MSISIHDNILISYGVFCKNREIHFHTETDTPLPKNVDVIFRGVEAYFFDNDNFGTIIFDILEVSAAQILTEERDQLEDGKRYGWPGWKASSEAEIRAYLTERNVRGFRLWSSYGMSGWVLAMEMEKVARENSNKPPL